MFERFEDADVKRSKTILDIVGTSKTDENIRKNGKSICEDARRPRVQAVTESTAIKNGFAIRFHAYRNTQCLGESGAETSHIRAKVVNNQI